MTSVDMKSSQVAGSISDDLHAGTQGLAVEKDLVDQSSGFDQFDSRQPRDCTQRQFPRLSSTPLDEQFAENTVTNNVNIVQGAISSPRQDGSSIMGLDDLSLSEFLRDIMIPGNTTHFQEPPISTVPQPYASRDVFDFGIDTSLDFNDVDIDWITNLNSQAPLSSFHLPHDYRDQPLHPGQQTPNMSNSFNLGAKAFQNSLWRWAPARRDNAYEAQEHLLLPENDAAQLDLNLLAEAPEKCLEHTSRDHILAMLLGTCNPANISLVVSSFPSTQVLSSLMHFHFKKQATTTDSWLHFPSFSPNNQRPELNAIVIAAGAVASSIPTVRKLGYAIQEAVRLAIPKAVRFMRLSMDSD